jgi:hypothetical protein
VRCTYAVKLAMGSLMSAMGQEQTHAPQQIAAYSITASARASKR